MALLALICLPFAAASLLALLGSAPRRVQVAVAAAANGMALALLLSLGPAVLAGAAPVFRIPWVPALGLGVSLWLDPLALLFAGLILGIGLLVVIYAAGYLAAAEPTGRFLSLLMLFQGAMIGIALSGNIILMLVFWELTSLSSFLLIGFWRDEAAARQGARMALTVTGGGGLALVGGMLLLGQAAGSFELQTILARGAAVQASPLFPVMLVLILLGAFTKSAQFPFHFWLPHAMAAPTPVSAYLHSATMVKAGVFLLARLWPVLAGGDLWFGLVATTGLVTMVSGAGMALVRHDLKTILAYSTVSQLGMMMLLLGFGTPAAAAAAMFHILNHAAFKAALFMVAGIVDHATGTRDLRRLGGLAALMPITAAAGTLATAAMAGLPPMGGFISKELMLGESLRATILGRPWLLPGLATVGALLSTAYSFRLAGGLFLGRRRSGDGAAAHDPGAATMVPPVLLAMAALGLGIAPMLLAGPLVVAVAGAVTGGAAPHLDLALWHGINPALGLGLAAIVLGALTGWRFAPVTVEASDRRLPDARRMFDAALTGMVAALRRASDWLHAASLQRHLFILFAVVVALGFDGARAGGIAAGARPTLPTGAAAIVGWFVLMAATLAVVLAQRRRLLALLFVSVIGLVVALAFVHLSAPDLALTQIATEVVTVILLLLTLHLLPKQPPRLSSIPRRARDGALAVVAGIGAGWLAWAMMTRRAVTGVSAYHWANSYSGGGGTNVVNVTLVDFRAFDTLGEIVVLGVAGLVIFALLEPASRGVAGRRLREWRDDMPHSPERHPVMFVMAARLLLPLALLVGIHIFLRGHNRPGGGFVAALVVAIAVLLQYLASGFDWTDARRRIGEHQLIASGVLIATATGLGSLLFGAPFLSSSFGYFHPPLLGEVELATAMLFDLGVAAAVVGAVMMALAQLSHVAQRAARHAEEDGAA